MPLPFWEEMNETQRDIPRLGGMTSGSYVFDTLVVEGYRDRMFARLFSILSLATLVLLFKRLVTRRPPSRPYRKAESKWPSRSYREPS